MLRVEHSPGPTFCGSPCPAPSHPLPLPCLPAGAEEAAAAALGAF